MAFSPSQDRALCARRPAVVTTAPPRATADPRAPPRVAVDSHSWTKGRTALVGSNDPVEVRALADRVLYLERGTLRGESGPDEI